MKFYPEWVLLDLAGCGGEGAYLWRKPESGSLAMWQQLVGLDGGESRGHCGTCGRWLAPWTAWVVRREDR